MSTPPILEFTSQYYFLSNFCRSPFTSTLYQPEGYPHFFDFRTVEHYYQAAKTADPTVAVKIIMANTPNDAKKMGRSVALRSDWEAAKINVMRQALARKFPNQPDNAFTLALLATGDAYLAEGNWWGDTFWGVCHGEGANWLGWLLMAQRSWLRSMQ